MEDNSSISSGWTNARSANARVAFDRDTKYGHPFSFFSPFFFFFSLSFVVDTEVLADDFRKSKHVSLILCADINPLFTFGFTHNCFLDAIAADETLSRNRVLFSSDTHCDNCECVLEQKIILVIGNILSESESESLSFSSSDENTSKSSFSASSFSTSDGKNSNSSYNLYCSGSLCRSSSSVSSFTRLFLSSLLLPTSLNKCSLK